MIRVHGYITVGSLRKVRFVIQLRYGLLTCRPAAKDPEVVKREIKLIQELLEEEPESKCGQCSF